MVVPFMFRPMPILIMVMPHMGDMVINLTAITGQDHIFMVGVGGVTAGDDRVDIELENYMPGHLSCR